MEIKNIISPSYYNYNTDRFSTMRKTDEEKDFKEKLKDFRHDMRLASLQAKENKNNAKKKESPIFSPNQDLFSKWDNTLSLEEHLENLDKNLSKLDVLSDSSRISVAEGIEHLASQYAIYNQHFKKEGNSEQIKKFQQIIQSHVEKFANRFSEKVGGFFEKNGMKGQKEKIYQSVQKSFEIYSEEYSTLLSSRGEWFEGLLSESGQKEVCLSFELRRLSVTGGEDGDFLLPATGIEASRKLGEIEKLADAAEKFLSPKNMGAMSEEELGIRLGELMVNSLSVLDSSHAEIYYKDAFSNAIQNFFDFEIKNSSVSLSQNPDFSDKPFDKKSVSLVAQAMIDSYHHTNSVSQAIINGKEFGMYIYFMKQSSPDYQNIGRYQKSEYFNRLLSHAVQRTNGDMFQIQRAALVNLSDYDKRLNIQNMTYDRPNLDFHI